MMPARRRRARPADRSEARRRADPAWSPDGTRLAFVSRVGGWEEPESEEEQQKSRPARVITALKYKLNGEGFIYDRRPHVFVVPRDGERRAAAAHRRRLRRRRSRPGRPTGGSSRSRRRATTTRDHDDAATSGWSAPRAASRGASPTARAGVAGPRSRRTARTIAYLGRRHVNEFGRNIRVFTVPAEGGAPTLPDRARSTAPARRSRARPVWSAGRAVRSPSRSRTRARSSLYRVAASADAPPERVIGGERVGHRRYSARRGAADRLAFAATDPVTPAEIFVAAADGSGERQLTDLNRAVEGEVALSAPGALPVRARRVRRSTAG